MCIRDRSGYALTDNQKMKLAAIEAMWETQPAPAGLTIFGIPDREAQVTHFEIQVPAVLGLISTRSFTGEVMGIRELVELAEVRISRGILAYDAVERLKINRKDVEAREQFELHRADLGYALLLKRHVPDPRQATQADIQKAALGTVPNVPVLFWLFRAMAGIGFFFIAFFAVSFALASRRRFDTRWFQKLAVVVMPLPWICLLYTSRCV